MSSYFLANLGLDLSETFREKRALERPSVLKERLRLLHTHKCSYTQQFNCFFTSGWLLWSYRLLVRIFEFVLFRIIWNEVVEEASRESSTLAERHPISIKEGSRRRFLSIHSCCCGASIQLRRFNLQSALDRSRMIYFIPVSRESSLLRSKDLGREGRFSHASWLSILRMIESYVLNHLLKSSLPWTP